MHFLRKYREFKKIQSEYFFRNYFGIIYDNAQNTELLFYFSFTYLDISWGIEKIHGNNCNKKKMPF